MTGSSLGVASFVRELFLTLNQGQIKYAVLRGYEGLPEVIGNDIDLGVCGDQLDRFLVLLRGVASQHGYRCEIDLYRQNVLKMRLVGSADGSVIKVDVWWAFKYCGLEYLDIRELLSSRQPYGELLFVARPEHEVALSFLKELLHMKRIREDKLPVLRAKQNARFEEPFKRFFRPALISRFERALNQERLSRPVLSWVSVLELGFSNAKAYGPIGAILSISECLLIRFFEKGKSRFSSINLGISESDLGHG